MRNHNTKCCFVTTLLHIYKWSKVWNLLKIWYWSGNLIQYYENYVEEKRKKNYFRESWIDWRGNNDLHFCSSFAQMLKKQRQASTWVREKKQDNFEVLLANAWHSSLFILLLNYLPEFEIFGDLKSELCNSFLHLNFELFFSSSLLFQMKF